MPVQTQEKTEQFLSTTIALGGVGLLIAENERDRKAAFEKAREQLLNNNYKECSDYLEVMDVLTEGKDKIFYIEHDSKLDGLVLEIIAEFEAGMASLADRKHNTGLKTATWTPTQTSFVIMMSRKQVEASYPRLFEYINFTKSL
ncbi:MAG: hypothetical protein CO002_00210 [Candidatus Portnoybacteria bacterium CG_4_8_14_3_um_filter_44_10]|uniref:Uncharacterized protein n=2 Tax=Candidatus Portnoyibacteriota TaxID=1817913 RepID=A0A2H0KQA8_9BACT|nr:MAG: hypothetical protein COV85_02780 [Candidatus Portnoybacteria bacterium CG11_big_fil_rev_8_21_14_0_20_44_10]PIW75770.1 MAG: hypothetical protein CO002_00210 [Candidatus Portnoybacteria bacterium CG_4_8_14_3_um_filter_44_10]PJA36990.1 MAG: hypothetical protein CO183_00550 [Candidatus Zambryskibacteria bacterium CG_4_9_14_3_um_filter_42_9]